MYGTSDPAEDSERTAFRRAEKKYKLYYESNSRKKKQAKQVDLSEVLDFKSILESHSNGQELPWGIFALQSDFARTVFCLENRPGFYFIPGALSVEEQCRWIKDSLVNFPQPPNRTNHNALYGPIRDLFASANRRLVMIEDDAEEWKFVEEDRASSRGKTGKSVLASNLLRKLRWSTLGLQFDWSKRNYNVSLPHNKIPDALCDLAKAMAAPAMPVGEVFRPEAAIVNYFATGDTLGGHLDDMEADWTKPIVSMSLGCKAIFLLGGKTREDDPLAMFLRSGDVVLMAGEARECFHGVPRIFADEEHAEIRDFEKRLSHEEDSSIFDYICNSRININIRQVF